MMNDDFNKDEINGQEPEGADAASAETGSVPTPEEEAEKAIEEARTAEEARLAEERKRREAEWEAAFRRAEEERRREQEEIAEAVRRENEAKEAARQAEQAEKKARKKKGLRLTAAVLAVALLVGSAGYAAGHISKTIQGLKAEVSSLQDSRNQDRLIEGTEDPRGERPGTDRPAPGKDELIPSGTAEEPETADPASTEAVASDPVIPTADAVRDGVLLTDVSDIVEKALPSVVSIVITQTVSYNSYWGDSRRYEATGAGSGIVIGDNGAELWVVTNHHVIEDADTIEITFCDGERAEAYVKGMDKENDLAVLGVKLTDMKSSTKDSIRAIAIGESDSLRLGQGVIAIGNALGWGQSVTTGVVSAFDREVEFEDGTKMRLLQTSAAINPGNSGGALLNSEGELIGINNAKYSDTDVEGIGFAIPISSVREIMERLSLMEPRVAVSEEDYPYIGVTFKELSSMYRQSYGIPAGAYIYEVNKGTPAEEAGLLAYDIITGLNGVKISSYDDLVNEMQYYKGGTKVTLTVMRLNRGQYSELTIDITLGFKKDSK